MKRSAAGSTTLILASAIVGVVLIVGGAFTIGMGSNPSSPVRDQLTPNPVDLTNQETVAIARSLNAKIDSCAAIRENEQFLTDLADSFTDSGSIGKYITTNVSDKAKREELNTLLQEAETAVRSVLEKGTLCGDAKIDAGLDKEVSDLWASAREKVLKLQSQLVASLAGNYYFPGVEQGKPRYCQQASAAMVGLTYLSNYGVTPITQLEPSSLPEALKKALEIDPNPEHYPRSWSKLNNDPAKVASTIASRGNVAWFTTPRSTTFCAVGVLHSAPRLLNGSGTPVPNDWVLVADAGFGGIEPDLRVGTNRDKILEAIKRSVTQVPPDPVVVDSTNSKVCSYAHVIPLFQFSGTHFVTNNPGRGSIKFNQTKCGRTELTEANVKNFVGVVIRKTHLQAVGLLP